MMPIDDEQIRAGLERLAGRDGRLSPKKAATRRRIVESATKLIVERGVRRIGMDDIAEHAGVSRATLYAYAKNKSDLVIKALAEEQLAKRRQLCGPEADPERRLEDLIADSIACFARMPLLARVVAGDPDLLRSLEHHPEVLEAFGGVDDHRVLTAAIREAFPDVSAERADAAATVLRTVASVGPHLVAAAPTFGSNPDELAERLAAQLVGGIRRS